MKKLTISFIGLVILIAGITGTSKAQTVEILAGNTLNGAMNGVLLGGATMGLQNSNEIDPVRIGVGLGTLYGIGIGVYDMATVSIGDQFYISGTFNDGTNSSIIVLLDTFYGAAAGAIISTSVSLVANSPVVEGIQYGASAGAWVGFGFGLIDAFKLSKRHHAGQTTAANSIQASGLLRYSNSDRNLSVGLLSPSITSQKEISNNFAGISYNVGIDVVNLSVRL